MLLTDGNPNTTEDLRAYESGLLGVANGEAIDLDVKLGLATEELTQEVLDFLVTRFEARRSKGVADVVVTRQMKRWHALLTLELVYRDAFNNQLNDRYKEKFNEYKRLAERARSQTFLFGVGLTYRPMPVASVPAFDFAAGPFEARTYFARVAWVSEQGAEGMASRITSFDAPAGTVPVVRAVNAPSGVAGFHVYLGLAPELVKRQTTVPVGVGQSFVMPGTGIVDGAAPGDGQAPDEFIAGTQVMRRG